MKLRTIIAERPGPHRPGVWAGFIVPEAVVAAITPDEHRQRKRLPVVVTLGDVGYRSSLTTQPDGWEFIASLEFRQRTGTALGDEVDVDIAYDAGERTIDPEQDVIDALAGAGLLDWFRGLPYSHQREFMLYIDDAKRPETRARRIAAMLESARR